MYPGSETAGLLRWPSLYSRSVDREHYCHSNTKHYSLPYFSHPLARFEASYIGTLIAMLEPETRVVLRSLIKLDCLLTSTAFHTLRCRVSSPRVSLYQPSSGLFVHYIFLPSFGWPERDLRRFPRSLCHRWRRILLHNRYFFLGVGHFPTS